MFDKKENRLVLPLSPVLRPIRRPQRFREGLCLFISFAVVGQILLGYYYCSLYLPSSKSSLAQNVANSTLGFSSIYAVSRKDSPRRQSLLDAAALTSLDITIPVQPSWTKEDTTRIKAAENSTVNEGSARAWLGHLNALEEFLKSTDETALIIEDDVDWDTRIRTQQIPQTAYAIRELLESHQGYYGNPDLWDIIWLGHCGDSFSASQGSNMSVIKAFNDPTMPNLDELHPWTQNFLHKIGAKQNQQRLVYKSVRPLCTFAYAVNRASAFRILNELAVGEPLRPTEHPCRAYDVRLLEGCRDEGYRCITVNPELFHHSELDSEIAQVADDGSIGDADTPRREIVVDSPTTNIRCSARSRRWKDIRNSIVDPSKSAELMVRELAESPDNCYIDDF